MWHLKLLHRHWLAFWQTLPHRVLGSHIKPQEPITRLRATAPTVSPEESASLAQKQWRKREGLRDCALTMTSPATDSARETTGTHRRGSHVVLDPNMAASGASTQVLLEDQPETIVKPSDIPEDHYPPIG